MAVLLFPYDLKLNRCLRLLGEGSRVKKNLFWSLCLLSVEMKVSHLQTKRNLIYTVWTSFALLIGWTMSVYKISAIRFSH